MLLVTVHVPDAELLQACFYEAARGTGQHHEEVRKLAPEPLQDGEKDVRPLDSLRLVAAAPALPVFHKRADREGAIRHAERRARRGTLRLGGRTKSLRIDA